MPIKDISYLELCLPPCLAERNHLSSFGPGHYEEHICKINLNLDHWFRRCCLKDISYLELWRPPFLEEWNHLCNFGRRHHEEQFCRIILNLDHWFRRRSLIKHSGGPFVLWSGTIFAILVGGIMRNNSVELF